MHLSLETVKLTSYFCHCLSRNEVPVPLFLLLFILCFRIMKLNCSLCQLISPKSRKIFFLSRAGIGQSVERLPQWWHDESQFQAPPMPAHRYVEDKSLAAMLATKRSAGVTPEVNLGKCVTHRSPPSVNNAAHSGFKTQETSPEIQDRGINGPTKRTNVLQNCLKKNSNKQVQSFMHSKTLLPITVKFPKGVTTLICLLRRRLPLQCRIQDFPVEGRLQLLRGVQQPTILDPPLL